MFRDRRTVLQAWVTPDLAAAARAYAAAQNQTVASLIRDLLRLALAAPPTEDEQR
jgi:hypothetical protein